MKTGDERLETFLRQFTPKRPRPLPGPAATRRPMKWAGGAVAAVLVLSFAALVVRWAGPPSRVEIVQPPPDLPPRPAAAHPAYVRDWNVDAADRMLTELSPRVLPDVERRDGMLHVLARE